MRGIMMIEPLYHQVVKGLKTQTRRDGGLDKVNDSEHEWVEVGTTIVNTGAGLVGLEEIEFETKEFIPSGEIAGKLRETCKPHYRVGEVLYVKEPTTDALYGATAYKYGCNGNKEMLAEFKWKNKMFMPASAARLFIQITGIRCERLLDISDEDCIAEGIEQPIRDGVKLAGYKNYLDKTGDTMFLKSKVKDSFFSLYRFANKLSAKKDIGNPWVWVYSFRMLKKEDTDVQKLLNQ